VVFGETRRVGLHDEVLEQLAELRALLVGGGAPVAAERELGDRGHVEMLIQQRAEPASRSGWATSGLVSSAIASLPSDCMKADAAELASSAPAGAATKAKATANRRVRITRMAVMARVSSGWSRRSPL
jgi:hypothetical protein